MNPIIRTFWTGLLGLACCMPGLSVMGGNKAQGVKTCLYIRVNFPDNLAEPISLDAARNLMLQVNQWYVFNSYNTLSIITDVTPLLTLPQPKSYYSSQGPNRLRTDARNVARAAGFETANYDLDIIRFTPVSGFNFGGNTPIGQKGCLMQNSNLGDTIHELGHSFGLQHANTWVALEDSVIGSGATVDYGNVFDMMGYGYQTGYYPYNANYRKLLGWLPDFLTCQVNASGQYRMHAYDVASLNASNHYALVVKKDASRAYWLEYNQSIPNNVWLQNGILINWGSWQLGSFDSLGGTTLLDATPETPGVAIDAALVVGKTLSDVGAGVHITPLRTGIDGSNKWIDVQVNVGLFPTNMPPTAVVSASHTNVSAGQTVSFAATASDPDGDALAYFWDFGDGSFGTNGPSASKSWASAGDYAARCTVSDMKGGTFSKTIVIKVGSPATFRISGNITNGYGQPVAGVRVHNGLSGSSYRGAWTDSDGAFTLVNIGSGNLTLTAVKAGYLLAPSGWSNPISVGGDLSGINFLATEKSALSVVATDGLARQTPGSDTGTFTIYRTNATNASLTVFYDLKGSASYGSDYTLNPAPSGYPYSIVIPAGATSATVTLTVNPAAFSLSFLDAAMILIESQNYSFNGQAQDNIMLIMDGVGTPRVQLQATENLATESSSDTGGFTVSRFGNMTNELTVYYSLSGTASNGVDYTFLPGSVTIPPGSASAFIEFSAVDDLYVEGDEFVTLTIDTNAAYMILGSGTATITIVDNDPPSVFIQSTASLAQESPVTPGNFVVTRIGNLNDGLTVYYLLSGTATNGVQYASLPGSVTIPAGQVSATITVTPINDGLTTGHQTVVATLDNHPTYNIGNPGSCTITRQDSASGPPLVNFATAATNGLESLTSVSLPVILSWTNASTVTVDYRVAGGTAVNPTDYSLADGTLTFTPGQTTQNVSLAVVNRAGVQQNRTIIIVLSNAVNSILGSVTTNTYTILDKDGGSTVTVTATTNASYLGPVPGAFRFTRTGGSTVNDLWVYYQRTGTASTPADFTELPNPVIIPAGQSFADVLVSPVVDNVPKPVNTVKLTLYSSPGGTIGSPSQATVNITNNTSSSSPPSITQQPTNFLAQAGGSVTNLVVASGTAPLAYQWYFNTNTPLANATNAMLVLTNVQNSNTGRYSVVITNSAGAVTSAFATLTINHAPVAGLVLLERVFTNGIRLRISSLLTNATDPDPGDTLSLAALGACTNGGTVVTNQGWVEYSSASTNTGAFTYTVADGRGGRGTNWVVVTSTQPFVSSPHLTIQGTNNSVVIRFDGIPGITYRIQSTTNIVTPNWQFIGTNTADAAGIFQFTLPPTNGTFYFRSTYP